MLETVIVLTPIHYVYLLGVIVILAAMIFRLDTPPVCILFLFLLGLLGLGTITGGIQAVFLSILYAAKEFMEIIATIALVTALSKCLSELGSSRILMAPMTRIMKNPSITWWILGISMFIFSLSVALAVGGAGGRHHDPLCRPLRPAPADGGGGRQPGGPRLCLKL